MSEDPTKDLEQKYGTKPTIETVLERINALDENLIARLVSFEERVGIRLDRMESVIHDTKANFHTLRADFNELRSEIRERLKETA
jgi:hypothetical protein